MNDRVVNLRLDYVPRIWQRKSHLTNKRFTVLALHRRAGKTELAIMALINRAIRFKQDLGMFVYIAPFLKQAKAIAWQRLKQKLEPMRRLDVVDINEGDLMVTFKANGAIIRLFGGDNYEALRGLRLDGAVMDEVAQLRPELWIDVVQPALSDRLGWAMFIGTPGGINLFSELYFKAQSLPDWQSARFTVYDTNSLDPVEVERLRRDMSETSFAREYLCDFSAQGDDQLISLTDAQVAAERVYTEKEVEGAPRVLGVDPARFGDDRSVVMKRQGLQAFDPIVYRGIDNMELAGRVAMHIDAWEPDAVFIDSGAGAGVIDRLRQLDYDCIEVPFGGRAMMPAQFVNRRSEMWWAMREWIGVGGSIPNDVSLKSELATPIYWFDAAGRKVLESKDEIKKRLQGASSPDMADALALTFAYPVGKKLPSDIYTRGRQTKHGEYDPYSLVS